ncbi:MAG: (Fe-S)-binding protein, partial [Chloroflexi bacterium]|nr:(Fe-S)-binding protein [Chloroflexota bacterium]
KHNVFGAIPDRRARWASGLDLPRTGDAVYFAGCHASYPKAEIARSSIAILRKAGINVAYLGENEWCCGVVQFHDGSTAIAAEMARHNVEALKASGAQRVITACAECYKSLKIEYPAILGKLPFEVMHTSELMAELVSSGKLELRQGLHERKMTFHDPCQLGRYCKVYDPPREILRHIPGVELVEMLRHRGNAWCCGNGADMVHSMDSELAAQIAGDRIAEARETGAEVIVSACPRCEASLERAGNGMKVYDLSVVAARAMGIET